MTPWEATDVAVVVPVGNGSRWASAVVAALLETSPPPGEIVVVADRVRDDSLQGIPRDPRVRVIPHEGRPGPAAARNAGAREASKPLVFFCDADVFVTGDFFARLAGHYSPGVDAVLGIEAELPPSAGYASRYKNLWMRYTYIRLDPAVNLFYTSCASIKRAVFLSAGGFDEGYTSPSVEDTAFGWTLGDLGVKVFLEKTLAAEHRKSYNTWGVIRTAARRASALARCRLRMGAGGRNRSSVPTSYVISLLVIAALPAALAVAALCPAAGGGAAALCLTVAYALNGRWLAYVGGRGAGMLLYAVVILPAELVASLAGGAWGAASYYLLRKRY